jgi:hypothetical protein
MPECMNETSCWMATALKERLVALEAISNAKWEAHLREQELLAQDMRHRLDSSNKLQEKLDSFERESENRLHIVRGDMVSSQTWSAQHKALSDRHDSDVKALLDRIESVTKLLSDRHDTYAKSVEGNLGNCALSITRISGDMKWIGIIATAISSILGALAGIIAVHMWK